MLLTLTTRCLLSLSLIYFFVLALFIYELKICLSILSFYSTNFPSLSIFPRFFYSFSLSLSLSFRVDYLCPNSMNDCHKSISRNIISTRRKQSQFLFFSLFPSFVAIFSSIIFIRLFVKFYPSLSRFLYLFCITNGEHAHNNHYHLMFSIQHTIFRSLLQTITNKNPEIFKLYYSNSYSIFHYRFIILFLSSSIDSLFSLLFQS